MLKVIELFSGIGTQTQALKNIGVEHEVVAIAEIDPFAIQAYTLLHGKPKLNLGDVSEVDPNTVPDHDLLTYSFPCTDISVAGAQEGLDEGSGTRSSTLWECEKIIDAKRPEFLLMENVKNLVGRTHLDNFHKWLKKLSDLGYTSYYAILNAKDFGVPQNRERVFVVSIQGERTTDYIFPEGVALTKCVEDILEDEVPGNMYMPQRLEFSANYGNTAIVKDELNMVGMLDMRGNESIRRVYHPGGICPTLTTMTGGHRQPKFLVENRVRKATPRECWRLMGFSGEQFDLVAGKLSNAQLYKLAGNAIVIPVLEGIFTNLFKADS